MYVVQLTHIRIQRRETFEPTYMGGSKVTHNSCDRRIIGLCGLAQCVDRGVQPQTNPIGPDAWCMSVCTHAYV